MDIQDRRGRLVRSNLANAAWRRSAPTSPGSWARRS